MSAKKYQHLTEKNGSIILDHIPAPQRMITLDFKDATTPPQANITCLAPQQLKL